MTAHTSHQPPGRYRFRQLARMEWIKLRSLRSTWLTLAIAVAASAGIALATGSSTTSGGMFVGNTLVGMLVGVLLIGVVGVLAMTSEYTSGTIRATFAAAPRRLRVLAAKAAVVGAVALITGEAAAFLSFFAGRMTLRHGITAPAASHPADTDSGSWPGWNGSSCAACAPPGSPWPLPSPRQRASPSQ